MKRYALTLSLAIFAGACATDYSAHLQNAQLNALLPGHSFDYSGTLPDGRYFSGQMTYNENGNLFVATDSGIPEGGTWRISNDQVCTRLVALSGGAEDCFFVFPNENGTYRTSHGFTVKRAQQ